MVLKWSAVSLRYATHWFAAMPTIKTDLFAPDIEYRSRYKIQVIFLSGEIYGKAPPRAEMTCKMIVFLLRAFVGYEWALVILMFNISSLYCRPGQVGGGKSDCRVLEGPIWRMTFVFVRVVNYKSLMIKSSADCKLYQYFICCYDFFSYKLSNKDGQITVLFAFSSSSLRVKIECLVESKHTLRFERVISIWCFVWHLALSKSKLHKWFAHLLY